ncbi:MAG: hypothetical protein E7532_06650 [Ruminococcaceae bacterium]|nr:hypothetical protein [Oscillospiraceae bacterium]
MTFKKIFAFMLAFLLVAGSVFSTSALAPPYSENFENEADMLTALSDYAEEYPYYDGFNFRSDVPKSYHQEYRQVLSVDIDVKSSVPVHFSFAESHYGQGVDYTFSSFDYENSYPGVLRSFVYYGYNTDEVLAHLETAKVKEGVSTFDEGIIDGNPYVICKSFVDCDPPQIDYYLAMNEYLIHIISLDPDIEDLFRKVKTNYTDVFIPVKIKDNADWFDKTLEKGYLIGDANSDGELNIKDATTVQKYLAKFGKVDKLVADFNGDLSINVKDATDIQKKLAGLDYTCRREKYPVTFDYKNATDLKLVEATMDSSGPLGADELIENYDTPEVERYTTVIESVDEFKAFFGKTHDKYDEEFFEENSLIYLYRWFITSSVKYVPDGLHYADGVLYISAFSDNPDDDLVECAFGNYNIFFEVNKKDLEGIKGVVVSEYTTACDD